MRYVLIAAVICATFAGCGHSNPPAAQPPIVAGAYTAQTPHATTEATIVDLGGGQYRVTFQPTGIGAEPLTMTLKPGEQTWQDHEEMFIFTDSAGRLWLDVNFVRYALHVSA